MALAFKRFMHIPLYVDAVQVTAENMPDVAKWCGGKVSSTDDANQNQYVKVFVTKPLRSRQTMAFVDDWVLKTPSGFKVYTPKAFVKAFKPIEVEAEVNIAPEQMANVDRIIQKSRELQVLEIRID